MHEDRAWSAQPLAVDILEKENGRGAEKGNCGIWRVWGVGAGWLSVGGIVVVVVAAVVVGVVAVVWTLSRIRLVQRQTVPLCLFFTPRELAFPAFSLSLVKAKKAQSCEFCNTEDFCILFWLMFLPLQVVPGFACSVASLNQSPGHHLPGCHNLRRGTLADYLLGQGKPSTQFAGHVLLPHTPQPCSVK